MPDFLSIKDAARRLGVKPKEIRRRIKDGELDGFVRLPGSGDGERERETGGFGPAAPNRRAAPPPEQDAHVQRLEETVLVLQSELNTRRQEVEELHVLLREIKDSLPVAAPAAAPAPAAAAPQVASAADVLPTAEAASAAPAEPEIDWGAYDAESEQLRATMGRLEALLEQLEAPEPELEPEVESRAEREGEIELEPEPTEPTVAKHPAQAHALEESPVPARASAPAGEPAPAASIASGIEGASVAAVTEPAASPPVPAGEPVASSRARSGAKMPSAPTAATDDAPTGEALGRRREKMGVSREALAAFARISWGFVTEVERGRRKDPRSRQRVAAALDAWQKRLTEERRKAAT